ncbi:hypothetical protein [Geodermatophilus poikilotrophus]|uniref:hypothetical protein n=1 Tax=Geodermatophilus poikilotrophus TaxID=1333667 RepID=UPI000B8953F5|nr:hypothetical protein [Geodermatophilus poikilotrophus]
MRQGGRRDDDVPGRALTTRAIVIAAVVALVFGVAVLTALLVFLGSGSRSQTARLSAVRTAGTIVVGTGGVFALLLAARRQRSTELSLAQQERVAKAVAFDAAERGVTELYSSAAEQLGSDKASVRLAGL